jgi:hypothetical protein
VPLCFDSDPSAGRYGIFYLWHDISVVRDFRFLSILNFAFFRLGMVNLYKFYINGNIQKQTPPNRGNLKILLEEVWWIDQEV